MDCVVRKVKMFLFDAILTTNLMITNLRSTDLIVSSDLNNCNGMILDQLHFRSVEQTIY